MRTHSDNQMKLLKEIFKKITEQKIIKTLIIKTNKKSKL